MTRNTLLIAVVLYKCRREESKTLQSLLPLVPAYRESVRLVIINNSKEVKIPSSVDYDVYEAEKNLSLAVPYNFATVLAKESGIKWMLTLDQDTAITESYLALAVGRSKDAEEGICAFIPVLRNAENHISPGCYDLEKGLYGSMRPIKSNAELKNLHQRHIPYAFNSATLYSVDALVQTGGFPTDYPLDMLDHAIFRKFYLCGLKIEILDEMNPILHELSAESKEGMSETRANRYLDKVEKYYSEDALLEEAYRRINPNASIGSLKANYLRYLLTMGIKRLIMGLIGRRSGNPTAWMYLKRWTDHKSQSAETAYDPFENCLKAASADYYDELRKI